MFAARLLVAVFAVAISSINCQKFYTILAPQTIRPFNTYKFAISFLNVTLPLTIGYELTARDKPVISRSNVTVSEFAQQFSVPVGELAKSSYALVISGQDPIAFREEIGLIYSNRIYQFRIRTDKAVYKPHDLVRFHVLVAGGGGGGKGLRDDTFTIRLKDPQNVIVAEWPHQQHLNNGFFAGAYQLAPELKLGEWSLEVQAKRTDQLARQTFAVARHILPNYRIDIEVERHVLFADREFAIAVRARHFYGMNVAGNVTVAVYGRYRSGLLQPIFQNPARQLKSLVAGEASFRFDFERDLRLRTERSRDLLLDVLVEEQLTNLKQNRTVLVTVYRNRYEIRLVTNRDNVAYQPGLDYRCELHLLNMDGSLARNRTGPIRVRYTFDGEPGVDRRFEVAANRNGIVKLQLKTFRNISAPLRLEAEFELSKEIFEPIPAASQPHVQISHVFANRNEYLLEFPGNVTTIFYTVSDPLTDSITIAEKLDFPSARNSTVLRLPAEMRQLYLYVYYLSEGSNVIVNGHLRNAGVSEEEEIRIGHRFEQRALVYEISGPANRIVSVARRSEESARPAKPPELRLLTNANYFRAPLPKLLAPTALLTTATRPPLAGPYAFSRIPKPVSNEPRVYLLDPVELNSGSFLENVTLTGRGTGKITAPLNADFVRNRFEIEAVASTEQGLKTGTDILTETPPQSNNLFRVSVNAPASVKLSEQVRIPVVVRNLAARRLAVTIVFKNDDQAVFDLVRPRTAVDQEQQFETYQKQAVTIDEQKYETVFFEIRAIKSGETQMVIEVENETIREPLVVVGEGLEQSQSSRFWCETGFERTVRLSIPEYQISDSIECEISVSRKPFANLEQNLGMGIVSQLVATESGSCDLAVLRLVPAVLLAGTKNAAVEQLRIGVQQVLRYWNAVEGSFMVFVRENEPGSVWMTAQVLYWLEKVRAVAGSEVFIDEFVLEKGYGWLSERQERASGSFRETGTVVHRNLQEDAVALTSFVLVTFLEYAKRGGRRRYETVVELAAEFIAGSADEVAANPLAVALAAYALSEANQSQAEPLHAKLMSLSLASEPEELHWVSMPDSRNLWKEYANAADIETTAYALLAQLSRKRSSTNATTKPIVNWLLRQQDYRGGFTSIQDTIAGLWSLKRYFEEDADAVGKVSAPLAAKVRFETIVESDLEPVRDTIELSVDAGSASVQTRRLPERKQVEVRVSGRGSVFVQVSFRYRTNVTGAWPLFILDPQINKISTEHFLRLSLCLSFSNSNLTLMSSSNMAIMEVKLPTGFVLDTNTVPALQLAPKVVNVQVRERKTTVLLIYNRIGVEDLCTSISAHRIHAIAEGTLRPGSISIYDMYNNAARARLFYENRNSKPDQDRELTQIVRTSGDIEQARIRPISENDVEIIPRDERRTKPERQTVNSGGRSAASLLTLTFAIFYWRINGGH